MSLQINTPTAMNMPQHYPQKEKSARTLTNDNSEQTCVARGEEARCRSLSPVGEKQVITPCKAIAAARGRKVNCHSLSPVGEKQVITPCKAIAVARGEKARCCFLSPVGEKQVITPSKAIAVARGKENRSHHQNSVGVQHVSFVLRLSQKAKNLTAKGAKGLRKERNVFILMHLFFATFAKNLCVFALKRLLRQPQSWHSRLQHSELRLSLCTGLSTFYAYGYIQKTIKIQ